MQRQLRKRKKVNALPTDQQTDRPTDHTVEYRVAFTRLKIQNVFFDVMNFSQKRYSKICENYKNDPIVTRFEPIAQGNVLGEM